MKLFCLLFIILPCTLLGQKPNDLISVRIGYGTTNIRFNDSKVSGLNLLGFTFDPGNIYAGTGPEVGLSKELNDHVYFDLSFSAFSGKDRISKVGSYAGYYENNYTLKGLQVPLFINYLVRRPEKRLRPILGAGIQYIQARLKIFETITDSNGAQTTDQFNNISMKEIQLSLRGGAQFRIIPCLYAAFVVKIGFSFNTRFNDGPCLSLKYTFRKK